MAPPCGASAGHLLPSILPKSIDVVTLSECHEDKSPLALARGGLPHDLLLRKSPFGAPFPEADFIRGIEQQAPPLTQALPVPGGQGKAPTSLEGPIRPPRLAPIPSPRVWSAPPCPPDKAGLPMLMAGKQKDECFPDIHHET